MVRFASIEHDQAKSGDLCQPKCGGNALTQNVGDESHLRGSTYSHGFSGRPALYQNSVKIVSNGFKWYVKLVSKGNTDQFQKIETWYVKKFFLFLHKGFKKHFVAIPIPIFFAIRLKLYKRLESFMTKHD